MDYLFLFCISLLVMMAVVTRRYGFFLKALVLIIFIVFAINWDNPDYIAYKNIYEGYDVSVEYAYVMLNKILREIGLNYAMYRVILSLLVIFIIHNAFSRILPIKYLFFLFSLYVIYPMSLDIIQIRNFIAMALFLFGFIEYTTRDKYGRLFFITILIIASCIHKLFIIYFIYILYDYISNCKILKYAYIIILSISVSFVFYPYMFLKLNIINDFFELYAENKIHLIYLNIKQGAYVYYLLSIFITLLTYFSYKNIVDPLTLTIKYENEDCRNIYRFVKGVLSIDLIMLLFMPCVFFTYSFFRFFRNIVLLNYACWLLTMKYVNKRKKGLLLILILIIISILYLFEIHTVVSIRYLNYILLHII